MRYEARGFALEPVATERDGRKTLRFELSPVPKIKRFEPLLPPDEPRWPHVAFTTGNSWAAVAAEYAGIVERQLATAKLDPLVREAVGAETARDKVIARLLAKTHELVRYTALEFGEAAIVPRTPEETLERRYGDCKDKSVFLVGLLRAAGIPAHLD